ncbi:siderophore-interacting protein [Modestobacter roseus]|uniref:NADPH-dependent ferric siderophore reductase n=1 Tax=Modestobacter roseus TaxID=1181884 RepID=A0A562IX50_9ACTN|nr:siderophore-interacting protein [Modestobacter roseus]MQA34812.1 siderophore-interacting protein [Modestobacter roseus]TWH75558.1 NADPH-dependent ferric siderophore reductase [Modestobacter roseus]
MQHGWEGVVLRAMRGKDFVLTVRGSERVGERYQRITVTDGGLLTACPPHPAMWIRLWFAHEGRPHQRAYTLVDPDPVAGTFGLEFALHDGPAADWSVAVWPGSTIDATVQGTRAEQAPPGTRAMHLVGDPASLPAVNSLLDAHPTTPARVWLEAGHPADRELPVRAGDGHEVVWVDRDGAPGRAVRDAVTAAWAGRSAGEPAADPARDWFWVACEAAASRELGRHLRRDLGVTKERVSALGYWRTA